MNFKNKRVISLVIVMVLVVFSLINGTLTKSTIQKQNTEDSYVQMFLRSQSVHKLTLVDGNSDETIQKISIEGEIGAEMTNTYSRASIINQIKEAKSNSNVKAILLPLVNQ